MHLCALRCTMPAKNPRLTITLKPSLAVQLRRLSELTGNSQSALIGDLLEGSGPVFDRMIHVLEAAKTAKDSIKGRLVDDMEGAQSKLEGLLGIAMEEFDSFTLPLLDEADAVSRRARRGPALRGSIGPVEVPPTPISNRGVRLDQHATKSVAKEPSPVSVKRKISGVRGRVVGK
jgi:hypothetical protein